MQYRACRDCSCVTLDRDALRAEINHRAGDPAFFGKRIETRPHLFAGVTVYAPRETRAQMLAVVEAVEAAARSPHYVERVLARATATARRATRAAGAFMGYDFHLGAGEPRLIEINTNAGGAYLAAAAACAHTECCGWGAPGDEGFEAATIAMFEAEWGRERGEGRPQRVAIVDVDPPGQFLYADVLLAARLFESAGIEAVVADPSALSFEGGVLRAEGRPIDLVYNRLTDFALEEPRNVALREAYLADAVVLTPGPRHHALYADKQNLIDLTDPALVASCGLGADHERALATIPRTRRLTPENADALWAERKSLFFKPFASHGGKGVYRGDKITRSVWARIIEQAYVAQELVRPSERRIEVEGALERRKIDVRLYTYDGAPILAAARVYQGQTTNFRTPGGGFAPLLFVDDDELC